MKEVKRNLIFEMLDALFILFLCFATLLTAMLVKGGSAVVMSYSINYVTALVTVVGLWIYFSYVLKHSELELKSMIRVFYREKSEAETEIN